MRGKAKTRKMSKTNKHAYQPWKGGVPSSVRYTYTTCDGTGARHQRGQAEDIANKKRNKEDVVETKDARLASAKAKRGEAMDGRELGRAKRVKSLKSVPSRNSGSNR